MATVTHKVVKGETLSTIASKYGTTVSAIASLNNIKNVNLIYVGQVLYISGKPASATTGGTSSTTSGTKTTTSTSSGYTTKVYDFGIQSNTDNTVFAIWYYDTYNTKEFSLEWDYCTADGKWFSGARETKSCDGIAWLGQLDDTYSPPSNAVSVRFRIKPVSKTYKKKVNNTEQEVSYWSGNWSAYKQISMSAAYVPGTPPAPTIKIEGYNLTCSVDNLGSQITWTGQDPYVIFEIIKNDTQTVCTGKAKVIHFAASYTCTIEAGFEYKARCRIEQGGLYSSYSTYSGNDSSQPSAPSGITECRASSETSVYLAWNAVGSAKTYEIEYATKKEYLGASNGSSTQSNIEGTTYEITGLESGEQYFFRVRACNEKGESSWTEAVSSLVGAKPTAPTTWSSTTTVISGEELILYWMHNSTDNSKETKAELELYLDDTKETKTVTNTSTSDEHTTSEYRLSTTSYKEGVVIKWRVRTAGITGEYGDWSIQRTVNVYAPATLTLEVTDKNGNKLEVLESFPMYVNAVAGPGTQKPTGYHVSIIANDSYETVDEIGNFKMVMAGDAVYSEHYDIDTELILEITPGSLDLQSNVEYTVQCTSSMNTGLTAEASTTFTVSWTDELFLPNAEIMYDPELIITNIRPYCEYMPYKYYEVTLENDIYTVTDTELTALDGESVDGAFTADGEVVYSGIHEGRDVYFCIRVAENSEAVPYVELSVYRREFDGKFTLIQDGIVNGANTFVTDPHPSLDYARYRIVARSTTTGAISYSDLPGYEIGEKSAILQWADEWTDLNIDGGEIVKPAWSGSMIKLMYNIDVSESNSPDVVVVNYIGREHPVSYYGTQVGSKATWSMDIPKYDRDTLYALRRLAVYMGDVYVREPSGSGYWANIQVSFSQTHKELVIPVSIEITRVSGGI